MTSRHTTVNSRCGWSPAVEVGATLPRSLLVMSLSDRTFAAVLFDNDGTLVDSTPAATRAWIRWAGEYEVDMTTLAGVHGRPARDIVALVAPHLPPEEALARIVELEEQDVEGVVALPGALAALRACRGADALVTSATRELARLRVRAAGLPEPRVIVSAEDVVNGKPDPEPFLAAARRLGVEPEQCLVVEDAPAGLAAARAAGMAALALRTTSEDPDQLDAALVVDNLDAVRFVRSTAGIQVVPTHP